MKRYCTIPARQNCWSTSTCWWTANSKKNGATKTSTSVSYTQLDVDKRQDFCLENGAINIKLTSGEGYSATGTANNDSYQRIRDKQNELNQQMNAIYQSMSDTEMCIRDRLIIMLGTNDVKERFNANAACIGAGMERLILKAKSVLWAPIFV